MKFKLIFYVFFILTIASCKDRKNGWIAKLTPDGDTISNDFYKDDTLRKRRLSYDSDGLFQEEHIYENNKFRQLNIFDSTEQVLAFYFDQDSIPYLILTKDSSGNLTTPEPYIFIDFDKTELKKSEKTIVDFIAFNFLKRDSIDFEIALLSDDSTKTNNGYAEIKNRNKNRGEIELFFSQPDDYILEFKVNQPAFLVKTELSLDGDTLKTYQEWTNVYSFKIDKESIKN